MSLNASFPQCIPTPVFPDSMLSSVIKCQCAFKNQAAVKT